MENQAKDELKELKEAFENWRNTRPGKKGITPENLRNKTICQQSERSGSPEILLNNRIT